MDFRLVADYEPAGDQPEAISQLVESLRRGTRLQTLLGVTGSGKTFTMANLIQQLQRPALVISHNKTLAAQLYSEFQAFLDAVDGKRLPLAGVDECGVGIARILEAIQKSSAENQRVPL